MRRGRIFFYLAFIVILGLVAVVVVWQLYFNQPPQPQESVVIPTPVEMTNVVIVTQRIPRGNVLDETVLDEVPFPRGSVPVEVYANINDVIGRQVRFDLDSGIPLTPNMLVNELMGPTTYGSNAALSIPRGMVAVSVPIGKLSSVSYAPQAGDHINVIVTMQFVDLDSDFQAILPNTTGSVIGAGPGAEGAAPTLTAAVTGDGGVQGRAEIDPVLGQTLYLMPSEAQRPRRVSQTLIQDAVVLRMGDFPLTPEQTQPTPTPDVQQVAAQEPEATPAPPPEPERVTIIVSPQDAVTLNYLLNTPGANLTLALRASGDDSRVQTEAVTLQFLLDQYRIPVPVKLPYGIEGSAGNVAVPAPAP